MKSILVVGAGTAGLSAAMRAGELGARTTLVTSGAYGGMAAVDGPVPVRTLAHAARLARDARQLAQYGFADGEPKLDYSRLLARVREVVEVVQRTSTRREDLDRHGVIIHEHTGPASFVDPHTVETPTGLRLQADTIILCPGGVSHRLSVPGIELTNTHSDAWALTSVPPSMFVIGGGDTGLQVASIFNAFGCRVQLLQAGPRILPALDEDVSAEVAKGVRASGIELRENFGAIESFEKAPAGVRMNFTKDGRRQQAEAALAVMAVGWVANTSAMHLPKAGVELDARGFVRVDDYMQTSAPHIFAAGDVTGRVLLIPQALVEGWVAATNAVLGPTQRFDMPVSPVGSFTDPEYASVGLSETVARRNHDVLASVVRCEVVVRPIVDGRTFGFCKLVVDRASQRLLGCHMVGERAVDTIQAAAIAISAGMAVRDLLRLPFSFPTYSGVLARAVANAARELHVDSQPIP